MKDKISSHIHAIIIETKDVPLLFAMIINHHLEQHELGKELDSSKRLVVMAALSLEMTFYELMQYSGKSCSCMEIRVER